LPRNSGKETGEMTMKKLMLITPPYHAGVVESAGSWPHLGLLYVAGHVRAAGYQAIYYDAMTKNHDLEQIRQRISEESPDYVGSTAYTSSIVDAMEVLRAAKEIKPEIKTIIGGIHANFMYRQLLEEHPYLDFVVRGEGEETVAELLNSIEFGGDLAEVKGIAYREKGEIKETPNRPFIENMDCLKPAWDLVDWDDYTFYVLPGSRLGLVNSSRGCTHECVFCSQQKFWFRSYRERSAENFVDELEFLSKTYSVNVVMLSDEYPTRNRDRWEKILDLMIERDVQMYLLLETCVGDILRDKDIMWKYRKAGVIHIYVGVEATNQDTLDIFKKNIACRDSREAVKIINDAGIISECSFVLGMPDESPEKIAETLELARHYNPDMAHFLMIAPWPYADIYEDLKDYITEYDYRKYNFVEPVVRPKNMTEQEIADAIVASYKKYYMAKVREYPDLKDDFKRKYMLRAVRVMMENSFLRKFIAGMGTIPDEVKEMMERYSL
jgi:anaerobic magnesium-protoporphyrin IX monomethyl ester cyclase